MKKLSLLFFTGTIDDAELLLQLLPKEHSAMKPGIVCNSNQFAKALATHDYDAIIAYNQPAIWDVTGDQNKLTYIRRQIPLILVLDNTVPDNLLQAFSNSEYSYITLTKKNALSASIASIAVIEAQSAPDETAANAQLLNAATELAQLGCWESDLATQVERWTIEQYRILGLTPEKTAPSLSTFIRKVHPEDVTTVTQTISEIIKHHDRQKFECRIMNADGQIKYVEVGMGVTRDKKGNSQQLTGYTRDITEERLAELNEKKVMTDLVQRNKDLEQFAYIISHNLKAPVANIVGASNTLMEGNLDSNEQQEFMSALAGSVKKLDNVITDLNHILQVRRYANEHVQNINLHELVEEIKSSIGVFLEDQFIMVSTDFKEVKEIHSSKSYLRSIFYNLITNSIKYRKPDQAPVIKIISKRIDNKIVIIFRDNGIGIDLEKQKDKIFGLYKRFHPDHAEGKGMGLFMVKTQAEALGGKISVNSNVGEGTEFILEFSPVK